MVILKLNYLSFFCSARDKAFNCQYACQSQETEVTLTPTRPVENVVLRGDCKPYPHNVKLVNI